MNVVVLYNEPLSADAADRDVLVQVESVAQALQTLGHGVETLACSLSLMATRDRLRASRPDVVFNLVESLAGTDRLMAAATLLLDSLSLPYTGCDTAVLLQTGNKLSTKRRLLQYDMPTPPWLDVHSPSEERLAWDRALAAAQHAGPSAAVPQMIIKSNWEHASAGLTDADVGPWLPADHVLQRLVDRRARGQGAALAEAFVDGREFNLSLLAGTAAADSAVRAASGQVQVLPPAEIRFEDFPPGKPRIVGYDAKWNEASFEYRHTPRSFEFPAHDGPLLQCLETLARQAWFRLGLRGYARVDFRVDRQGRPWLLEINANPCLSPDAGFAAALERAGIPFVAAVERMVADAMAT